MAELAKSCAIRSEALTFEVLTTPRREAAARRQISSLPGH
jgi:hypothetical protein